MKTFPLLLLLSAGLFPAQDLLAAEAPPVQGREGVWGSFRVAFEPLPDPRVVFEVVLD